MKNDNIPELKNKFVVCVLCNKAFVERIVSVWGGDGSYKGKKLCYGCSESNTLSDGMS